MSETDMIIAARVLLKEYLSKVEDCDKILESIVEKKKELRKKDPDNLYEDLRREYAIHGARRQAYVQFTYDLKHELLKDPL